MFDQALKELSEMLGIDPFNLRNQRRVPFGGFPTRSLGGLHDSLFGNIRSSHLEPIEVSIIRSGDEMPMFPHGNPEKQVPLVNFDREGIQTMTFTRTLFTGDADRPIMVVIETANTTKIEMFDELQAAHNEVVAARNTLAEARAQENKTEAAIRSLNELFANLLSAIREAGYTNFEVVDLSDPEFLVCQKDGETTVTSKDRDEFMTRISSDGDTIYARYLLAKDHFPRLEEYIKACDKVRKAYQELNTSLQEREAVLENENSPKWRQRGAYQLTEIKHGGQNMLGAIWSSVSERKPTRQELASLPAIVNQLIAHGALRHSHQLQLAWNLLGEEAMGGYPFAETEKMEEEDVSVPPFTVDVNSPRNEGMPIFDERKDDEQKQRRNAPKVVHSSRNHGHLMTRGPNEPPD